MHDDASNKQLNNYYVISLQTIFLFVFISIGVSCYLHCGFSTCFRVTAFRLTFKAMWNTERLKLFVQGKNNNASDLKDKKIWKSILQLSELRNTI